jgi:hypothetical protein
MAYLTRFTLTVISEDPEIKRLQQLISNYLTDTEGTGNFSSEVLDLIQKEVKRLQVFSYKDALEKFVGDNVLSDSCSWYEHDEDMKKFSLKYPGMVFCLTGEGEEAGDLWKGYYRDGKSQKVEAQIVYPPFDPEVLT